MIKSSGNFSDFRLRIKLKEKAFRFIPLCLTTANQAVINYFNSSYFFGDGPVTYFLDSIIYTVQKSIVRNNSSFLSKKKSIYSAFSNVVFLNLPENLERNYSPKYINYD